MYFKERRIPKKSLRITAAIARFLAIFVLSALLLEPMIHQEVKVSEPSHIILAVDNSNSVAKATTPNEINDFIEEIKNSFQGTNELGVYTFGVDAGPNDEFTLDEKGTNISSVFSQIKQDYEGREVGGVILLSDGIYNTGQNPIYHNTLPKVPFFTLGLGDTTQRKDAWIENLRVNSVSYIGNEFPINALVRANGFSGKNLKVVIEYNGKSIFQKSWTPRQENDVLLVSTFAKADKKGLFPVAVSVSPDSENPLNNRITKYIEVKDDQKKILILAGASHPDINGIKEVIEKYQEFKVVLAINEIPKTLDEYDVVLVHDINNSQFLTFREELKDFKGGLIIFEGEKISPSVLEKNLFSVTPAGIFSETGQWQLLGNNGLFDLGPNTQEVFKSSPEVNLLLSRQKIGDLKVVAQAIVKGVESNYPIIMAGKIKGYPRVLIRSTDIWRTRMYAYAKNQSTAEVDELMHSLLRYSSTFGAKDRLMLDFSNVVNQGVPFTLQATVLTSEFVPTTEAEVTMTLQHENDRPIEWSLFARDKSYFRKISQPKPGNYTFEVNATYGDEKLVKKGRFSVSDYSLEDFDQTARWDVLRKISDQSYGNFIPWSKRDQILNELRSIGIEKPRVKTIDKLTKAISDPLFLILLLLFLTIEWGVRRWSGWY